MLSLICLMGVSLSHSGYRRVWPVATYVRFTCAKVSKKKWEEGVTEKWLQCTWYVHQWQVEEERQREGGKKRKESPVVNENWRKVSVIKAFQAAPATEMTGAQVELDKEATRKTSEQESCLLVGEPTHSDTGDFLPLSLVHLYHLLQKRNETHTEVYRDGECKLCARAACWGEKDVFFLYLCVCTDTLIRMCGVLCSSHPGEIQWRWIVKSS